MTKKFNQYVGKALAVMSEFLMLGWNVAIPEVDIGDEIFVVQDDNGTLRRVQVKTSMATQRLHGFSGQFSISVKNLKNITNILVHYVFIVRQQHQWSKPLIVRQDYLRDHFENNKVGVEHQGNITFYISFSENKAVCSGHDFSKYIQDFSDFPIIHH